MVNIFLKGQSSGFSYILQLGSAVIGQSWVVAALSMSGLLLFDSGDICCFGRGLLK